MGTTTFYLKHNDLGKPLNAMSKKEIGNLNKISPYSKENYYPGWDVPFELHNGNVYFLVFWKGQLIKLEDAPKKLNKKYRDKYRGKTLNLYEWTILKKTLLEEIKYLDKEFKKNLRKN